MPSHEAKISPMDRGFLFGDGIYEVIPTYEGNIVGLHLHLERMRNGLAEIGIQYHIDTEQWIKRIRRLISESATPAQSVYIHISRGTDAKRFHAYPDNLEPTVYAFAFPIPDSQNMHSEEIRSYHVVTSEDKRWQRCHIKSTSLLGNVMHYQHGKDNGKDEVILYNGKGQLTEASSCNVFVVKDGLISTPPLDHQILPGVTRQIVINAIREQRKYDVQERIIHKSELDTADEVWITSSSKEVGPVLSIDDKTVGTGVPGQVWRDTQQAYNELKFRS
ncbi:aminotransferase class IV [Glaciecola sp. MH2013]|uniref:aminotransferase class IV n=1 Tax=Glaciecola sp. MH2013 TaxID=2785524 RepID=UPI00189D3DBF|nr:aminotransferase class IV [Glaciecola sp. MH2013]MBF7072742.1 aminotransferase class IV [Glaciecola sp. MH2013]